MNFNTKDVYIEKNTDPIKIDFHKNLTDNDLKNIQNKLKKDSIDFIYQLKRNKQKEIIQFSSEFKSVTGSVKANTQSDKKGIASFYFFYGDKGNGVKFLNQKTNLKNSNPNIIEIVFNKNTTLKKLKEQSKYLKENYNINFDFEIENKDKKLADFKHSFYNGEQKHEATFLKVFPFSSINHSFILKYNIETKLLWIDAIVDGVTYDSTSKRYLDNNSVGFYIDNTDTDKTLKKYKKLMKEKGVDIAFLDIKRDSKNRITAIRIHAKTKNSKSSYNYKLDGKTYNGLAISFYSNGNGLKIKPVLNTF